MLYTGCFILNGIVTFKNYHTKFHIHSKVIISLGFILGRPNPILFFVFLLNEKRSFLILNYNRSMLISCKVNCLPITTTSAAKTALHARGQKLILRKKTVCYV